MSITAIRQSDSLYGIFGANTRSKADAVMPVSPNSGRDTATFSEEAMALIEKMRKAKAGEEEAATEKSAKDALRESLAQVEKQARTQKTSMKEAGAGLFAMMLESLFLADLEENSQAAAQSAEDGMPRKQANPLENSAKSTEIKNLMKDVASGKADIADIPKAMASGGGGKQPASPATKQATEKTTADTAA